ncbi:MAG TPA: DUF1232 domain-containing protein [Acidimicrobiia bacterium]|nr:DUF1232 domain-containing protein [Acidimicrobiia bacterium]
MSERPQWKLALDAVVPSGKLLYRLAGDDRVPRPTRVLALAALAYAVLPIDLIPDSIPVLGKVDDFGLAAFALVRLVNDAGPELVQEHWDGDADTLEAFLGAVSLLDSLIPARVRRLVSLLDR